MVRSIQEVACSPDQLEVDVVVTILFSPEDGANGPAGLLNRRLNYCLSRQRSRQSVLVRCNHKIASEWVLFYSSGTDIQPQNEDLYPLFEKVLQTCRMAGFGSVAFAAPESALVLRNEWNHALSRAAENEGFSDCLVTYDHSYQHDHSGPVF